MQFTRNPGGLSGALQKIGQYGYGSRLESEHAPDLCHMFFGNGLGEPFFGLMATHPPIPDRIRAIDPAWDGKFPPLDEEQIEVVKRAAISELEHTPKPMPDFFKTVLGGAIIASGSADKPPVIRSHSVLPNLGNPTPLHLKYAEQLRDSLPDSVKAAAREPLDAAALIYAMLLSPDETTRATQLAEIAKRVSSRRFPEKTAALFPDVSAAATHAHLPMVNLALGALRQLTRRSSSINFRRRSNGSSKATARLSCLNSCCKKSFCAISRRNSAGRVRRSSNITRSSRSCRIAPSCCPRWPTSAAAMPPKSKRPLTPARRICARRTAPICALLPREQCGVDQIDAALNRLALAVPTIKKNLIEACVHTVGADGVIQEAEAELLRAVADTLDCPIPPFVQANGEAAKI